MKGGGGSSTTTSTSKTEPWKKQSPYLEDIYKLAQNAYGQTPKDAPPQQTVAPFRPEEIAAQEYAKSLALNFQGAGAPFMNMAGSMANGDWLWAESNPYLQSAVDAAITPAMQQFQEEILPGIQSQAIASGAYGGTREGITSALAGARAQDNMQRLAAEIAYGNYAQERSNQLNIAPLLMQQGMQLEQMPGQLMESVGYSRRAMDDAMLKQAWDLWQANQNVPWTGLDKYSAIIQGGYPGGQSSVTSPSAGTGTRVFQGALGGAGLGALGANAIGGLTGTDLIPYALAGLGVGGLGGIF